MFQYYAIALSKYATFEGRARRAEYWYFNLCNGIFSLILGFALGLLSAGTESPGLTSISGLYNLALFLPSLAVGVRRMHDLGKSGWFIWIPVYNLILAASNGQTGTNRYGPDPKQV